MFYDFLILKKYFIIYYDELKNINILLMSTIIANDDDEFQTITNRIKNIHLNAIFPSELLHDKKYMNNFAHARFKSVGYNEGTSLQKKYEMRRMRNLGQKLNSEYLYKLSLLLYTFKKNQTTNYSYKRKNLNKLILKFDDKEGDYRITLPEILKKKLLNKLPNKNKLLKSLSPEPLNLKSIHKFRNRNNSNKIDKKMLLNTDIITSKDESNPFSNLFATSVVDYKNISEEQQKYMYDLLKTKYHSNDNKSNFSYENSIENNYINNTNTTRNSILPNINNRCFSDNNLKKNNYEVLVSTDKIKEFDPVLGKYFKEGKFKKLTERQKQSLLYISDIKVFNYINKLKEKNNKLNKLKGYENKKIPLNEFDFFHLRKKKSHENFIIDKKIDENSDIDNLNHEINTKMTQMKSGIDSISTDRDQLEVEVNRLVDQIERFIDKNKRKKTIHHKLSVRKAMKPSRNANK